jgi:UDP-N-acetyl-alpha-D-muramoyl-L-alanyl-L-glutamate epimerase
MNAPDAVEPNPAKPAAPPVTEALGGQVFRYEGFATDSGRGLLTCRYSLDGREFAERITLAPGPGWDTTAAQAAARLVYLLAGVSYYKTAAPPVIDLGDTALTERELAFLREFYLSGLGEYAYRNNLDLRDLTFTGQAAAQSDGCDTEPVTGGPGGKPLRPLIPFGGGIDSIVTVEGIREHTQDIALFVVSRPGARFDAIEQPAAVSGLPVVRADREIDPQLLRSTELGFRNGHVPVTGIISAIAILAATLDNRDAVVMSNEWSASAPTIEEHNGRPVNHQWSKSESFERDFRDLLSGSDTQLPDYFSALRDRTELWVGERFAKLTQYHGTFRSCNRAFHLDTAKRWDHWCGSCDKCCFIDLILSPFMDKQQLETVFAVEGEPLAKPELKPKFETLLGSGTKPFECVGEVNECRAAVVLAAARDDRTATELLQELAAEVTARPDVPTTTEIEAMRRPVGVSFVPAYYSLGA